MLTGLSLALLLTLSPAQDAPAVRQSEADFARGVELQQRGDLEGARALLARLDRACTFGCPEAEELRRWIAAGHAPDA